MPVHNFGGSTFSALTATNSLTLGAAGSQVILLADAANTLAQRNGTAAQTFRIYNTYTDASNYERLAIRWSSDIAGIFTDQAGSGAARKLQIGTLGDNHLSFVVNGATRWEIGLTTYELRALANLNLWNGTSALATTATAGFLGVNSCAGPPTGVPASVPTGQVPLVFDTTNGRLYFYHGAAWHHVAQTA